MTRTASCLLGAALALGVVACGENTTGPSASGSLLDLTGAFSTVPVGFNLTESSFDGSVGGSAWQPHSDHFGGGLMGGGLGPEFMGLGFGMGRGFGGGHGPHGDDMVNEANCSFNSSTGRVECPAQTVGGLTITKSIAFTDAAGKAQSAFDSVTTNTINTRIAVSGTFTRDADMHHGEHGMHGGPGGGMHDGPGHDGNDGASAGDTITVTVQNASDHTVSGLAKGSTQRTINGTSAGKESFAGKDTVGTFTAQRVVGDTTKNVVIPVPTTSGTPTFPTAGTVIRQMQATITYTGKSPQTTTRREVLTYDGSNTAKLVITEDGTTKNCTIALPRGRPVCQ